MPTYDYRCNACDHEFEEFQSITAPVMKKCPECKKLKLERLIGTGAAVMFKGGGFYETDYRSESYKKAAKADSDAAKSSSESKSSSKSDSKPDKKTESKPAAKSDSKPGPKSAKKDA
ncbi:MAG: FmdB family zinc ribbon protein [Phycisphaerales bacterium]